VLYFKGLVDKKGAMSLEIVLYACKKPDIEVVFLLQALCLVLIITPMDITGVARIAAARTDSPILTSGFRDLRAVPVNIYWSES